MGENPPPERPKRSYMRTPAPVPLPPIRVPSFTSVSTSVSTSAGPQHRRSYLIPSIIVLRVWVSRFINSVASCTLCGGYTKKNSVTLPQTKSQGVRIELNGTVCWMCCDGGELILFSGEKCGSGWCITCLGEHLKKLRKLIVCPMCFRKEENERVEIEGQEFEVRPYQGFEGRSDSGTIEFWKGLLRRSAATGSSSESVLILVYALAGLALETTPIPMLVAYLQMLFPQNFAYIPIIFDMGTVSGQEALKNCNKALTKSLKTGELCSIFARTYFIQFGGHGSRTPLTRTNLNQGHCSRRPLSNWSTISARSTPLVLNKIVA
ncbi:hypothetical protein B0H14DRAFT_2581007 [Mycena olivaceomarginata]|nr:hypothetical protein B0H14DRAFT_2581007 [Mycena olivaceomarginata]